MAWLRHRHEDIKTLHVKAHGIGTLARQTARSRQPYLAGNAARMSPWPRPGAERSASSRKRERTEIWRMKRKEEKKEGKKTDIKSNNPAWQVSRKNFPWLWTSIHSLWNLLKLLCFSCQRSQTSWWKATCPQGLPWHHARREVHIQRSCPESQASSASNLACLAAFERPSTNPSAAPQTSNETQTFISVSSWAPNVSPRAAPSSWPFVSRRTPRLPRRGYPGQLRETRFKTSKFTTSWLHIQPLFALLATLSLFRRFRVLLCLLFLSLLTRHLCLLWFDLALFLGRLFTCFLQDRPRPGHHTLATHSYNCLLQHLCAKRSLHLPSLPTFFPSRLFTPE